MSKYKTLEDCEGIEINYKKEILKFACCDCGLVHDMAFAIEEKGKLGIAFKRNNRATGQRRRYIKKEE